MPPIHPAAVSAGVIALSMAVAAAIAVYESPEVRRMADDLRRRIAVALHSLGEGIAPEETREPLFNRPEDADGFLLSHRPNTDRNANDAEIDADEASRRRQREELLYWNRIRLQREQEQQQQQQQKPEQPSPPQALQRLDSEKEEYEAAAALAAVEKATQRAAAAAGLPMTTFDQLLRPDSSAERGTYVVHTGADYGHNGHSSYHEDALQGGLVRRRRPEGVRGLNASFAYANPFGDEFGIDADDEPEQPYQPPQKQPLLPQFLTPEQHAAAPSSFSSSANPSLQASTLSEGAYIGPEEDELMSDIYNATPVSQFASMATATAAATADAAPPVPSLPASVLLERALEENEFTTAGQAHVAEKEAEREAASASASTASFASFASFAAPAASASAAAGDAYSSIQAWAHTSSQHAGSNFYSPLPVSPVSAPSEPEIVSTGELTPTDSLSVIDAEESAETRSMTETVSTSAATSTLAPPSTAEATPQPGATAGANRYYDVVSDSDSDDQMTLTSWTEVGSVMSESDASERAGRARP